MEDLEFVQRCIKGNKQAWDEFLNKYSRLIYSYIYKVINIKGYTLTQANIEDLFQEIIFSLIADNFKKLRSFRGINGCSLASWLRQVAINFTIDYLRKFKTPLVSLDAESEDQFSLKETIADNAQIQSEEVLDREKLSSLTDCIKRLDTDDRYFLELNINRGLSLEELKDFLGVSRGAIDMRKSRIIQRLRDCFKDKGFILSHTT
jgi:RNA polymerase sigma-70 factor (ECF subfamily)